MRLFVAVQPPAPALDSLARRVAGLHLDRARAAGVNTRLIPPQRWHLTLVFLGEVADDRVPEVTGALRRAVRGWSAGPPSVRLAGGGRFGRGRFTVLWTGVQGDTAELGALSRAARRELKRDRLPYDAKPFRPHLTLARVGDRLGADELAADLASLAGYRGPPWRAEELLLMRSHLGPKPVYERLAAVRLGPAVSG